ncbi:(2Fe-2S)-binding protein [Notoacmeibacter ruber]|uniref:(2Fe-2S)-binding protein n=1 Tax=Notoacmeibacter ruber TaxID=2670375 RepID=UPI001314470E|nr:(2Fe-2S)-binding protein [Notoacmeibacter ruber]
MTQLYAEHISAGYQTEDFAVLVCSCNLITSQEIRDVITEMLDQDPWRLIVPVQVYHAMEKRGRCCGCFPAVVDLIVETTEAYHERLATPAADVVDFIGRLRTKHALVEQKRREARARSASVRVA